jgi:hypothetical protein
MVTTIKPTSPLFTKAVGTVFMSLLSRDAWLAISKILTLCLSGSGISVTFTDRIDMDSLAVLLVGFKNVRNDPAHTSDWAWRTDDKGSLSFFWKSGNPLYDGKREVSVYISYTENVVSFSWDTGTGKTSELITNHLFVHVPVDEVIP